MTEVAHLVEGQTYKFTYKQQSGNNQWYQWDMIATYLERHTDQYEDKIILSGRPAFGTTEVRVDQVIRIQEGYTRHQVRRPKRFPGAIQPRDPVESRYRNG
jgi:hypothetical protein